MDKGEKLLPVVLVHGFSAHAHWFDEFVPLLQQALQGSGVATTVIAANDLSGMGDSRHRDSYDYAVWGDEIAELIEILGGRVRLVGHSMGGRAAVSTTLRYPERVERLILLDSIVVAPPDRVNRMATSTMTRRDRIFDSLENACATFRLIPPQPCANKSMVAHIARHSYKEDKESGGWVWKSDGQIAAKLGWIDQTEELGACRIPLWMIRGQLSQNCDEESCELLRWSAPSLQETLTVENAYHHLFLDQPQATAEMTAQALNASTKEGVIT